MRMPSPVRYQQQIVPTMNSGPSISWTRDDLVVETELIRRARDELGVEEVSEDLRQQRERNALYSRRSYHKRMQELTRLQGEAGSLRMSAESLRAEQRRLETLLDQANKIVASLNP